MRAIEDHGRELAHDGQRTHVDHQIVVAEAAAALGQEDTLAARIANLLDRMTHVPGRNELSLLDVDCAAALPRGDQQVSLAAEKCGNLQHIDGLGYSRHVSGFVYVSQHGDVRRLSDPAQNAQTFVQPRPAKAANRSAIGLVVRSFEDVRQFFVASDGSNGVSHLERVSFALDDARSGDEEELASADGNVADLERLDHTVAL